MLGSNETPVQLPVRAEASDCAGDEEGEGEEEEAGMEDDEIELGEDDEEEETEDDSKVSVPVRKRPATAMSS